MEPKRVSFTWNITIADICLIVIMIFIILAYFKGWNN